MRRRRRDRICALLMQRVRKSVRLGMRSPDEIVNYIGTVRQAMGIVMAPSTYDGADLNALVKRLTRQVYEEFGVPPQYLKA